MLTNSEDVSEYSLKLAIYGSFMLYLDLINLFLNLQNILGLRK